MSSLLAFGKRVGKSYFNGSSEPISVQTGIRCSCFDETNRSVAQGAELSKSGRRITKTGLIK